MSKKLSKKAHVVIVLPTYNEAENISVVLKKLNRAFQNETTYRFSILVVDDNSPDGTADVVRTVQKKDATIHLLMGEKQGLGAAYIRGMNHAAENLNADILFEMDSDLQHDPILIPEFLRKLEQGADYIVGSRYIPGGSIPANWGVDRKLFSVAGNLVIRYGLMVPHIHEWTNGFRAMRVDVFLKIKKGLEKYTGYIFQIASMHRVVKENFVIAEVPINFLDRKYGESKIIPKEYIPDILKYIFLNSSFVKFVITGSFGFLVDFIIAAFLISLNVFKPTANAISAEFAIAVNFVINNSWSFKHKRIRGGKWVLLRKFIHFNVIASGSIFIQYTGMYVALHTIGDGTLHFSFISLPLWIIYKVIIIVFLIIPYSFVMYNRFVWKDK